MGIANQFSRQSAVHTGYGAVLFVGALFVLAPNQDLRGLSGKTVLTPDIGQLKLGLRGETGYSIVMLGQPVQALLHIHFAFDPVIAKVRQEEALHRLPRSGLIHQGTNIGVEQIDLDPVRFYILPYKPTPHPHPRRT